MRSKQTFAMTFKSWLDNQHRPAPTAIRQALQVFELTKVTRRPQGELELTFHDKSILISSNKMLSEMFRAEREALKGGTPNDSPNTSPNTGQFTQGPSDTDQKPLRSGFAAVPNPTDPTPSLPPMSPRPPRSSK